MTWLSRLFGGVDDAPPPVPQWCPGYLGNVRDKLELQLTLVDREMFDWPSTAITGVRGCDLRFRDSEGHCIMRRTEEGSTDNMAFKVGEPTLVRLIVSGQNIENGVHQTHIWYLRFPPFKTPIHPIVVAAPSKPRPYVGPCVRYCWIAGSFIGQRHAAQWDCVIGERLLLDREPDNPHDKNAIVIRRLDGQELGYVPAADAVTLAPLMDAGQELSCKVNTWRGRAAIRTGMFELKVRISWHQASGKGAGDGRSSGGLAHPFAHFKS
jgi:hypothetical protein